MLRTLLFLGTTAMVTPAFAASEHFVERSVEVNGRTYRYQVFVPISPPEHPAVVLFLHGSGERGDDNTKQLAQGLPPWLDKHPDFPAIVVIPQTPDGQEWTDQANTSMAMAALEQSITEFHGDRHRLYLTGLSMGGYGSWQIAAQYPGTFAAAAIICGGVTAFDDERALVVHGMPSDVDPFEWTARKIGHLPVWIFHGAEDHVVPTWQSRRMYAALTDRQATVRYTEFPGVNHGSWDKAYGTPDLWTWMFAQRRP